MEGVMLKLCNKIARRTSLSLQDLIYDWETFEEIPLIGRVHHLSLLNDFVLEEDRQDFLINFAMFYLNGVYMYAHKNLTQKEVDNFFACLTFFSDDPDVFGYYIPHFLVTRKKCLFSFLKGKENKFSINGFPELKLSLERIGLLHSLCYVAMSVDEENTDDSELYVVPEKWFDKLRTCP
jgi:hypothetical protein